MSPIAAEVSVVDLLLFFANDDAAVPFPCSSARACSVMLCSTDSFDDNRGECGPDWKRLNRLTEGTAISTESSSPAAACWSASGARNRGVAPTAPEVEGVVCSSPESLLRKPERECQRAARRFEATTGGEADESTASNAAVGDEGVEGESAFDSAASDSDSIKAANFASSAVGAMEYLSVDEEEVCADERRVEKSEGLVDGSTSFAALPASLFFLCV